MPIYEYVATSDDHCTECQERFEVFQKMSDPALETCPSCGAPIARVLSSPSVHGANASGQSLTNKNLASKGFTKYVKAGGGYYEKVAGKGPDVIKR